MADPRKLLEEIVSLIETDITHIKKSAKDVKIHTDDAMDLSRYSKALIDIIAQQDLDKKEEKEALSKLSREQLKELAMSRLNKKDDENQKIVNE